MGDVSGGTPGGTGGAVPAKRRLPGEPEAAPYQGPGQIAAGPGTGVAYRPMPGAGGTGPKDNQPGGDVWRGGLGGTDVPQQNGPRRSMSLMPVKSATGAPQGGGFQRPNWGNSGSGSSGIGNVQRPPGGPRGVPGFSGQVPEAVMQRIKAMQMRRGPSGGATPNPNIPTSIPIDRLNDDPNFGVAPARGGNGLDEGGRRPQPGAAQPWREMSPTSPEPSSGWGYSMPTDEVPKRQPGGGGNTGTSV